MTWLQVSHLFTSSLRIFHVLLASLSSVVVNLHRRMATKDTPEAGRGPGAAPGQCACGCPHTRHLQSSALAKATASPVSLFYQKPSSPSALGTLTPGARAARRVSLNARLPVPAPAQVFPPFLGPDQSLCRDHKALSSVAPVSPVPAHRALFPSFSCPRNAQSSLPPRGLSASASPSAELLGTFQASPLAFPSLTFADGDKSTAGPLAPSVFYSRPCSVLHREGTVYM